MDDDFVKKRLERDLAELQRMCDDHFKKRADDEELLGQLQTRMSDRQKVRFFQNYVIFPRRSNAVHGGQTCSIVVVCGPCRSNAVHGGLTRSNVVRRGPTQSTIVLSGPSWFAVPQHGQSWSKAVKAVQPGLQQKWHLFLSDTRGTEKRPFGKGKGESWSWTNGQRGSRESWGRSKSQRARRKGSHPFWWVITFGHACVTLLLTWSGSLRRLLILAGVNSFFSKMRS